SGLKFQLMGLSLRKRVLCGAPPEMIIAAAAESGADLIVMSTHGRSGLMRLLYGSVTEAVLRGSPVPVLVVPNRVPVRVDEQDQELARLGVLAGPRRMAADITPKTSKPSPGWTVTNVI